MNILNNNRFNRCSKRVSTFLNYTRTIFVLNIVFLLLLFSSSSFVNSQPTIWQKVYKGYSNQACYGYNIVNADNDNYFFLGENGYTTCVNIYKINKYGDTIFTKYFPGLRANSIVDAGNGNIVFVASVFNGPYNGLLNIIKLNSQGQYIWGNICTNTEQARCYDIIKTTDYFYVMCGNKYQEGYAMKIDNSGNIIWQKMFPTTNFILYNSILETADNCYLLSGNIKDSMGIIGIVEGLLTKIDSSGNYIWEKRYLTPDSISGVRDMRIVKHKEGYIMGGQIYDSHLNSYIMFNKIDVNGNIKYTRTFPSLTGYNYYFADVKIINDNRILFLYRKVPYVNYDSTISGALISDTLGNVVVSNSYSNTDFTRLNRIYIDPSNHFLFAGYSNHIFGVEENAILIKTDTSLYAPPIVSVNNISTTNPDKFSLKQNYPNPFNSITQIEFGINKRAQYNLKIFDVTGKLISELFNQILEPGEYKTDFNASNYSSGIYFYKLESSNGVITKKLVLLK